MPMRRKESNTSLFQHRFNLKTAIQKGNIRWRIEEYVFMGYINTCIYLNSVLYTYMFDYFYMLQTRKHIYIDIYIYVYIYTYIYMCKKVVSTVLVNREEACFRVVVGCLSVLNPNMFIMDMYVNVLRYVATILTGQRT